MKILTLTFGLTLMLMGLLASLVAQNQATSKALEGQGQTHKLIKGLVEDSSGALSFLGLAFTLALLCMGVVGVQRSFQGLRLNASNSWNALCFRKIDQSLKTYIAQMAKLNRAIASSNLMLLAPPTKALGILLQKGLKKAQYLAHLKTVAQLASPSLCRQSWSLARLTLAPYKIQGMGLRRNLDQTAAMAKKKSTLLIVSKMAPSELIRATYSFSGRFQSKLKREIQHVSKRGFLNWRPSFGAFFL